MVSGNRNKRLMRIGLSVIAAAFLSSNAFAQDANEAGGDLVMHGPESVAPELVAQEVQVVLCPLEVGAPEERVTKIETALAAEPR